MSPPSGHEQWPLVVVGAGAAGLLAATVASRRGRETLLLETRPQPGAKIRVSGGGRCNILPVAAGPEDFWTGGSRHLLRNVLRSWPLEEVRAHFERDLALPLKDEPSGKVFPASDSSRDVVRALLQSATDAGVRLVGGERIVGVTRDERGFHLATAQGSTLRAERVVLATGGCSLPKTGSDGAGWRFARSLGHTVRAPYPALVPLTTSDETWRALAGVAVPAGLRIERGGRVVERWSGDFLFTHRGFSGPGVLHVSRHFTAPDASDVSWRITWGAGGPEEWNEVLGGTGARAPGSRRVGSVLRERLPRRLVETLLTRAGVPSERMLAQLRREERVTLLRELTECELPVDGSEGYRTAEVTAGGVPLEEVRVRSLESRVTPGLHLAGEILDVAGRLGGFNFLWAWVSGRLAGEGAVRGPANED